MAYSYVVVLYIIIVMECHTLDCLIGCGLKTVKTGEIDVFSHFSDSAP